MRNVDCVLHPWNPCEKMTTGHGPGVSAEGIHAATSSSATSIFCGGAEDVSAADNARWDSVAAAPASAMVRILRARVSIKKGCRLRGRLSVPYSHRTQFSTVRSE